VLVLPPARVSGDTGKGAEGLTGASGKSLDKCPGRRDERLTERTATGRWPGGDHAAPVAGIVKASCGYAKQYSGGGFTRA